MWAFRRSSNPPCWPVFGSSWSQVRGWFAVEGLAGFWRRTWRTLQIDLQLLMVGQLITGGGRWSLCTGLVASWPGWPVCSLTAHNSSLTAGDNKSTAESVGRQVGLLQGGQLSSPGPGSDVPGSSSPSLSGGWAGWVASWVGSGRKLAHGWGSVYAPAGTKCDQQMRVNKCFALHPPPLPLSCFYRRRGV